MWIGIREDKEWGREMDCRTRCGPVHARRPRARRCAKKGGARRGARRDDVHGPAQETRSASSRGSARRGVEDERGAAQRTWPALRAARAVGVALRRRTALRANQWTRLKENPAPRTTLAVEVVRAAQRTQLAPGEIRLALRAAGAAETWTVGVPREGRAQHRVLRGGRARRWWSNAGRRARATCHVRDAPAGVPGAGAVQRARVAACVLRRAGPRREHASPGRQTDGGAIPVERASVVSESASLKWKGVTNRAV
jgi:hypothetical protein